MIRKIYLAYWVRTFCGYLLKPCTEKRISEMSGSPYMGGMDRKCGTCEETCDQGAMVIRKLL